MKKKIIVFSVCGVLICLLLVGVVLWLMDDPSKPPADLPVISKGNTVTLASNGCCFVINNIVVYAQGDTEDSRTDLIEADRLGYFSVSERPMPELDINSVSIGLEFSLQYGDQYYYIMHVLDIDDVDQFKEEGLLIYFKEGAGVVLNVLSGDLHISYVRDSDHNWILSEEPVTIYASS